MKDYEWRVTGGQETKKFQYLNDARKYVKKLEAGSPDSWVFTIERYSFTDDFWEPYE